MKIKKLLLLALFVVSQPCNAENHSDFDGISHVTAEGKVNKFYPANQFSIMISAKTEHPEQNAALSENNKIINQIIQNLLEVGMSENEFETAIFQSKKVYSTRPRNPPSNWQAKFLHFEVTNGIEIKSGKLDLIGAVIQAATEGGASSISNPSFSFEDTEQYELEVILLAGEKAMKKAEALAKAPKGELGRLLSSSSVSQKIVPRAIQRQAFAKTESAEAPQIFIRKLPVTVTVTSTFEVIQKGYD